MIYLQEQFQDAVFEFVKQVSSIPKIYGVFLFGSVAKGEADSRSDIDFLIVLDTQQDPDLLDERNKVSKIALDLEKKFDRNIQIVLSNTRFDKLDGQFIEDVLREGIILFGRPLVMADNKLGFSPYVLIHYELTDLSSSGKMKVKRALYGYETRRSYKGKVYTSRTKGLVNELDGKRTGIASILLPQRKSRPVLETLERFGAKISKEMVWLPETRYETQFDTERFSSNISIFKDVQERDTKEKILETIRHQAADLPHDGMSDSIRSNVITLLCTLQNECDNETMRKSCLDILSIISGRRDDMVNAKMKELFLDRINRMYSTLSIEEKNDALRIIQRLQRYDSNIIHKLILDAIETWTQIEFQNLLNSIELSRLDKEEIERLRKRLWNLRASAMRNQEKEKADRIDRILELYIFH
jgi:predicted nucleotidyltransferase